MPASYASQPAPDQSHLRRAMVDCQIRTFDVSDHAVIARFLAIPREKFLPPEWVPFAYSDMALKLPPVGAEGEARSLLAPAVLARLIQAAAIKPTDKILDIASTTGYSTAILAGLAQEVVALEAEPLRADVIKANLATLEIGRPRVSIGPLATGVPSEAPFDVILVNGGVETRLHALFQQLRSGGRLLAIVRKMVEPGYGASHAVRFDCQAGRISSTPLFDCAAPVLTEFRRQAEFVF